MITPTTAGDIPGVVSLQRECFPPPFPQELLWSKEHIKCHLQTFARGQFVAKQMNRVVASCTNMLVSQENWESHLPWEQITGGLSLRHHDLLGKVLYGIDISVHPDYRNQGIGRLLYKFRFDLVTELSLNLFGTVCRLPGFSQSNYVSPSEYAQDVSNGLLVDATLTPLLKMGLKYKGVIRDYMEDDESADTGAILIWTP